jgi:hypothetical protein
VAIQSDPQWHGDTSLSVGDVRYDLQHEPDPVAGRLRLYKTRSMIEHYEPIVAEFQGANIVELGIFGGGSTGYFAQRCRPRRMVAIELSTERVGSLDAMLADRGLDRGVRLHYGVDQGDRARLQAIVDDAFGDEPVDLVIDDASHVYGPTRASFEVLFPRVRPGGLYVIEDWGWADWEGVWQSELWIDKPALSKLIFELVMACTSRRDVIARVDVSPYFVAVTKGEAVVEPEGFSLSSLYLTRGKQLNLL